MKLEKLLLGLGKNVFLTILRYKVDDRAADTADGFADIFGEVIGGHIEATKTYNQLKEIETEVADLCNSLVNDFPIEDARKEALIENLSYAYKELNPNVNMIFTMKGDYTKLSKELLLSNPYYEDNLNPNEYSMYRKLIDYTAHYTVNAFELLPQFTTKGIKTIVRQMDDIKEKLASVSREIDGIASKSKNAFLDFESRYRMAVLNRVRYINIDGSGTRINIYSNYELDTSYIKLSFDQDGVDSKDEDESIENILLKHKNVWISGDAGSGKTTLLQWIALRLANKTLSKTYIPVLVTVRSLKTESLKSCIENIMSDASSLIPDGWIEHSISLGRFFFLFDGFDEVDSNRRHEIFNWIRKFDHEDKCHKVFTARPQVKEDELSYIKKIKNIAFVRSCPMGPSQIKDFILKWHKSVLITELGESEENAYKAAISLHKMILISEPLLKLASSPLLCAMICSLNHVNNGTIPYSKKELYDECIVMLIESRDRAKKINEDNIHLNIEQKKRIFSRLAYWMMRNDYYADIEYEHALSQISIYKHDMGLTYSDEDILHYFLNRSGLIRTPEPGIIEFIHRSFLEYLCAIQIVREKDWGFLATKIGNNNWRETIIDAISMANKKEATRLITCTLEKISEHSDDARKYLFLAFSYVNSATEVEANVRDDVIELMGQMIPPKRGEEALIANEVQKLAIPFLVNKHYPSKERLSCIRTLRFIGGVQCLKSIVTFMDSELTYKELFEMCKLFEECDIESLKSYGIPDFVAAFYSTRRSKVIVNNTVVSLLLELDERGCSVFRNVANKVEYRLEEFNISDYGYVEDESLDTDDISAALYENLFDRNLGKLFSETRTLIINGGNEFDLSMLDCFTNLEKLYITNNSLSIYTLNDYIIPETSRIREITLIMHTVDSIYFNDLNYLKKCEKAELILLNYYDEIIFDTLLDFDFKGKLSIGCYEAEEIIELLSDNIDILNQKSFDDKIIIFTDNSRLKERANQYGLNILVKNFSDELERLRFFGLSIKEPIDAGII